MKYGDLNNTWFSSGLQFTAEIRAMTDLGIPCGISLNRADEALLTCLEEQEPRISSLFVDSGAFSESGDAPLSDADWVHKLDLYDRLIRVYGKKCVIVAPDRVGDQEHTLALLRRYKARLMPMLKASNVIVPLQICTSQLTLFEDDGAKGMTQREMYDVAREILNDEIIAGIPFKKKATSLHAYATFLRSARPPRVHILGVTPFGERWRELIATNHRNGFEGASFDGCRVRALIGQKRSLTRELKKREDLPRMQAMYESLMVLKHLFIQRGVNERRPTYNGK